MIIVAGSGTQVKQSSQPTSIVQSPLAAGLKEFVNVST